MHNCDSIPNDLLFILNKQTKGGNYAVNKLLAKQRIENISSKIEAYAPRVCILDFEGVSFMDSSGIAVVINALRCMTKLGGELLLEGLSEQPLRIFKMAGIEKLVKHKEVIK